ncbi:MAG: efflux RND transporter periplasmic adaptor subunit [Deferrisomatales bacterium]|nr:efflux RND transporter periplasmic adaptor subunit [Deferrisomatales bacterium]
MAEEKLEKKPASPVKVAAVSALLTLAAAAGAGYWLGYFSPHPSVEGVSEGIPEGAVAEEETLYTCGMHPWIVSDTPGDCPICGMKLTPIRDQGAAAAPGERRILYWRAPMDPMEIYDRPGKSKMGMDLVPVYEDELVGGVEVRIDPVTQQNMGVRTARAEMGPLVRNIRAYGRVTYDETRTAEVSPKFSGWIEELHADFTGQLVRKDEPLFEIYSPELVAAQEEYLTAHRNLSRIEGQGGRNLLESARRRLSHFDVPEDEIRTLERTGEVRKTLKIRSPFTGVVTHKNAVQGVFIRTGTTVYKIADLSRVWVDTHIYEYEMPWVEVGQEAHMTLPYLPGKAFQGKVSYVNPYLQRQTRDVVVRLEFDNPDRILKPDMYAEVNIKSLQPAEGLRIPSEAVIRSGTRDVVFVTRGDGKFTPREVKLGLQVDGGKVQVLSGVVAGEHVVTSGQFLLDSESRLKEALQKMMEARMVEPETEESDADFFEDL